MQTKICDGCKEEITFDKMNDEFDDSCHIHLNGTPIDFCIECTWTLEEFVKSKECEELCKKRMKERKEEMN